MRSAPPNSGAVRIPDHRGPPLFTVTEQALCFSSDRTCDQGSVLISTGPAPPRCFRIIVGIDHEKAIGWGPKSAPIGIPGSRQIASEIKGFFSFGWGPTVVPIYRQTDGERDQPSQPALRKPSIKWTWSSDRNHGTRLWTYILNAAGASEIAFSSHCFASALRPSWPKAAAGQR